MSGGYHQQARTGNIPNTRVNFTQVNGGVNSITISSDYLLDRFGSGVYLGDKQLWPREDYKAIASRTINETDGAVSGQHLKVTYLSRGDTLDNLIYTLANQTPEGTVVDTATTTAISFLGFGSYAIGLGSGTRYLKLTHNTVRLPDLFQCATAPGWTSGVVTVSRGSAAPVAGTYSQGDMVFNSAPTAAGYLGWVCVTAGSPGTWKGFGAIQS
jgi:hypothetical protein